MPYFLEANHCNLDISAKLLHIPSCKLSVPVNDNCNKSTSFIAVMADTQVIPPCSELEVMALVPTSCMGKPYILETKQAKHTALVARALVTPTTVTLPVRLLNPYSESTTIFKGCKLATLEEVDPVTPISVVTGKSSEQTTSSDLSSTLWNIVNRSTTKLDNTQQQDLYNVLLQYHDIFATDKHDPGRTNALKHQINTGNAQPIRQHACRVPPARRREAEKLLDDMLNNNIIQPSSSPWASPVVLVRKRMVHYDSVLITAK